VLDPVYSALNGFGLNAVSQVIYQAMFWTNYLIVDLVFAYLTGDLTNDTSYAWIEKRLMVKKSKNS